MDFATLPDLNAALKTAKSGYELRLAPGTYGPLGLDGLKFAGAGIVITSVDPKNPARLAGVEGRGPAGITLRNLAVTVNARTRLVFRADACERIVLDQVEVYDTAKAGDGGVLFNGCTNVAVTGSKIHDVGTGVRFVNSTGATLTTTTFRDVRGDGVQLNGTSRVTIRANDFADFHVSPGDHPDAIQFFNLGQQAPTTDITITDNVIRRGAGDITQGIFLGTETAQPYVNVKISGNAVIGSMYRAISVGFGRNVSITDNLVVPFKGQDAAIYADTTNGLTLAGNRTPKVIIDKSTNVSDAGFTVQTAADLGDEASLRAWLTARNAVVVDPRDAKIADLAKMAEALLERAKAE